MKKNTKILWMTVGFIVCVSLFSSIARSPIFAQSLQEIEVGAGLEVIAPFGQTAHSSKALSTNDPITDNYNYISHIFTVADIIFFSYKNDTKVALYDSRGRLIWDNDGKPLNKGEHAHIAVSRGVYTACGSEKFAVLTGDPITRYVVGYYAMDQNGYGTSTEFYTWVPSIYGHCSFIVFAYEDNTQVTIENTDTGVDIARFILDKGEHWQIETLDSEWLHITATKPVSALTCYDQGYFVPSANGKWSGTEFYTYVSDIWNWSQDLTIMAYDDGTSVTIKDSDTGRVIWSGTLNGGEAHVESYPNGAGKFFTITSNKPVTVSVQPWASMSCCYHQGAYVADSTGTMLGTDLIASTLNGGYLYILAYRDNTNVVVYNSQTGDLVASYTLDEGDYVDVNPGNGLWRIMSNHPVSAYSGWGYWNADFAPIEFREITAVNVEISTDKDKDDFYNAIVYEPNESVTIRAKVTDAKGNPLYPLKKNNFKVSVDGSEISLEEFKKVSATNYKIKIKAPSTPGDYTITVKVTTKAGEGMGTQSIVVPQGRKALVVGITEYNYPLFGIYEPDRLNPYWPNEMAKYFENLGFDVIKDVDQNNDDGDVITYDEVSEDVRNLVDKLDLNDVAVVYIDSHGMSTFGKYWLCYGDDMYSEDAMFPGDTRHVTGQLDDIGTYLDFLWLQTCSSWAYQDEIDDLGAGGIIFFGNDGLGWSGNEEAFYAAIAGKCYTTVVKTDKVPEIENNPGIKTVEIIRENEAEDTVIVKICSKQQRYIEAVIDDINIPNGKDSEGNDINRNLRIEDQYPGKMDLTDPLLKHKSPDIYIPTPEEPEQVPNETFASVDYTSWDSDGDGLDDAATISWDANTTLPKENIIVKADIKDSNNRIVKSCIYGPYTIYGDLPDTASFNFYSTNTDTYNIRLMLYDSSMNPVNVAFITDLPLNAGTGGPGGDEEFTNSWFNTSDSDGDGIADTIKVSWNANTTLMEEDISILALVRDKVFKYGPYTIYTSQLNKGEIEFYAGEIGTYEISLYLIDSNSELEDFDFLEVPLGTSTFTNNYTDYGIDMNADGKYDYLAIDIEIDVITDGNYTLRGILYDRAGNPIMTTTTSTYLTEGIKTVQLNFDGQTIYESEVNGPYELRYLTLYKDGTFIGHRNRPYTTLAYNYREFQPPPTTLNWNLTNPLEVLLDQTFDVVMIVANPSGHTLTNLQASLTLPSELDTTGPLVKDIGNLEPSQTKEIYWILKGTNVGYGEITVNITSPDIQSVSATRDIVVTHFPLSVETDKETYMPGDNVIVTTKLTNNNPEISYVDLSVDVIVEGPGVEETYSMPIDYITSLESRNFALTWDSTGKPVGNYIVEAKILEDSMVLSEISTSFVLGEVVTSGDLDNDGDVDQNDLNILLTYRNQSASACPECDIDGDGIITVLDARKLVLMCTRPRCATE